MKLAVVCYPTFGGSGVVATELAIALGQRGHEVHVVSTETPVRLDRWIPNLSFHTVEVGTYPLFRHQPYATALTNKLIELVHEHGVEIIHSHYAIPHAEAAYLAREVLKDCGREVKLACTLHGTDITLVGKLPSFNALTRFTIAHQDLLTAPSEWLADQTEDVFGVSAERIHAIPNFVDLDRFQPNADSDARRCLAKNGEVVISHASNMRPVKRVVDVVKAFAVVCQRMPAVLALAGDGPDLPRAEAMAKELGVRDRVRLLGTNQRIEHIFQASDLFMLPSNAESFGLVALEAMACGVPVIGYRAGGLPEVVEHNVSGLLCDIGGDQCMGTLAADLLSDQPRLDAMRAAARNRAETFAPTPIIDQYESLLLSM